MRSLSRQQVRAVDRYAIETLGIPGVVLMENAGRNVADAIESYMGSVAGQAIAVVAGAGNNGGDGFVVARHLAMRGAKVVTFLAAPGGKIAGDAKINLDVLRKLGHEIRHVDDLQAADLSASLRKFAVIVDALAGTGLRGAPEGALAAAVEQVNRADKPVVAVDIPTGLDCDSGRATGPAVRATMTVTFVARKKGFDCPQAAEYTGKVIVADIGIPPEVVEMIASSTG
jgi:NAD(P)H-hydrate epimerase